MSQQNSIDEQAALELFAKQASAEGIDLDTLEDEQVEAAYAHFVENILPELFAEETGEEVEGSDEEYEEPGVEDKIAAAQNALAFDAFLKAAAAEDVDLNEMDEDDVAELFGAWLVQDVPALFEEQAKEAELLEYAKIAQANLSEMTVMGQHLGEVAADAFLAKIADGTAADPGRLKQMLVGANYAARGTASRGIQYAKANPVKAGLAGAGALGVAGAGAYGAAKGLKAMKARKAQKQEASKSASAIDERVLEILAAHGLIEG